jgi:hypothetical protein
MEDHTYEILVTIFMIFFMTGLFFTWYFIHKARVKERLLLIEKGIDISDLSRNGKFKIHFPWLKIGFIIAGGGFGIVLGEFLRDALIHKMHFPLMFMFGGIGMVAAHFLEKPKAQQ